MSSGPSLSNAIDALPEAAAKRALLGMKPLYRVVIEGFQKFMPIEDTLLKALTHLNPREQKTYNSLQYCRALASEIPSVQPEVQVTAGNEWIRYQEFEMTEDDVKVRIDNFWHKIFSKIDTSGEHFLCYQK